MSEPVVFIVDDDASIRDSLRMLVESAGWRSEGFASASDFLKMPDVLSPSCLLLDLRLPDLCGLELQRRIAPGRRHMPIIFMTGYGDVSSTVHAMKAGALEFLTKPFIHDQMLRAVGDALDRSRSCLFHAAQVQALRESYASLSTRERQVLAGVVGGRLNKQVGGDLGISEMTVKAHRGQVMRKMKARSLAELVGQAAELGIAPGGAR